MAQELDVYRDWLRITDTQRPLSHYQLLRLKPFEDNTQQIRTHYRKMNAHVRKFATGDYTDESQVLLNELAKAMLCLTDVQRKREYDATLGRKDAGPGRFRTFEEILLANKVIDQNQLAKARSFADAVGLDIHQAVMQKKMATPDVVMLNYAEAQGLPYIELDDIGVDEQFARQIPPPLARQHSCVPVMVDGDQLLMASPSPLVPDVEEELRLRLGMPVRTVLCTPASINQAISKFFSRDAPATAPPPGSTAKEPVRQEEIAAKPEADPPSKEEESKRRLMLSVIGFNVTVVAYVMFRYLSSGGGGLPFFSTALVAVVLGLIVAGTMFAAASVLKF